LIAAVAFAILAGLPIFRRAQWSWRRALGCAASLVGCAAAIAGPYMAVIGGVSVKPAAKKMVSVAAAPENRVPVWVSESAGSKTLFASTFAIWWVDGEKTGHPSAGWGLWVALNEVMHAFRHLAFFPALLGFWWFRGKIRQAPGMWLVVGVCGVWGLLIWRVAVVAEYLSERHTLILVLCGSFWAAAALVRIGDALAETISRIRPLGERYRPVLATAFLVVLTTWCLPQTLRPLHANRTGYRAAGAWLATHADRGDPILDPYAWAHFYAGRVFDEEAGVQVTPSQAPTQYVVLEKSKLLHSRLKEMAQARDLSARGTLVFRWTPGHTDAKKYHAEEVLVYAVPITPQPQP